MIEVYGECIYEIKVSSRRDIYAIINSLKPDNVGIGDNIKIEIYSEDLENRVLIVVKFSNCKLSTLLHTLEDLLRCLSVSLKAVGVR